MPTTATASTANASSPSTEPTAPTAPNTAPNSKATARSSPNGVAGNGPAWFKIWTKSGQIIEYGNTADSRIEAQGKTTARAWALNKIADTKGNTLTVSYTEDNANGDYYPQRIDYTGNAAASLTPNNSVQFVYETRPDITPLYQAGSLIKNTVRLKNVQTYAGSAQVKDYRLAYDTSTSTQRSRLTGLTECAGDGVCRSPMTLTWGDAGINGVAFGSANAWTGGYGQASGWSDNNTYPRYLVDVNGDGLADVVGFASTGVYVAKNAGTPLNLLKTAATGLGATTSIAYTPLTDPTVYTKDTTAVYPLLDLQSPLYVVSTVASSNGIGGTVTTNYKYGGAKADLSGRGFLGFRWLDATQIESGLTTHTEYRQDWPYVGLPSLAKKTLPSGGNNGVLTQATNTYGCTNPQTGAACIVATGNRYFPYLSQSIETGWDINGAGLPTVTTSNQYDPWGNPTQITIGTNDGYSKTTTNTYNNDSTNWLLGRLIKSTVTSTTP